MDSVLEHGDLFLTITGNYCFTSIEQSLFAHWRPNMIHLDLAVERKDFPVLKTRFNPVGKRRFVYVGHVPSYKNTRHLSAIAARLPDAQVSHIGTGMIRGLTPLGYQNFATEKGKAIVASHDFLLTVGKAHANPTTVLEGMAWGLIPVSTPQSGYVGNSGIVNVPLDDVARAVDPSGSTFFKVVWEVAGGYYPNKSMRVVSYSDRDFQLRVASLFPVAVSTVVPFVYWRTDSSVDRGRNS